jgi:hypothetical protein
MSLGLTLPLAPPRHGAPNTEQVSHLNTVSGIIAPDASPFRGDNVARRYHLTTGSVPASVRTVAAIWPGTVAVRAADRSVTIELGVADYLELSRALPPAIPIPIRATYGPVLVNPTATGVTWFPAAVGRKGFATAGASIGSLHGTEFWILLQDQNGYLLDVEYFFRLFQSLGLWALPTGAPNHLAPAASGGGLVHIAGPAPLPQGSVYLTVGAGSLSRGLVIHNPPHELPTDYFSFLSSDSIEVGVVNMPPGTSAQLKVTDVTDPMYRTKKNPPVHTQAFQNGVASFVPQTLLKPYHTSYAPANGKRTRGVSLQYRMEVTISGGANPVSWTPPSAVSVKQDDRDIIRQEYVFHGSPFQNVNTTLAVPPREQLERVDQSISAAVEALQNHNYGLGNGGWMLNSGEALHVLEFIRRRFVTWLDAVRAADPTAVPSTVGDDLQINSAWRNPERNEAVEGARTSNHQFGRALDLSSVHRAPARHLFTALFGAGRDFLDALIAANGANACKKVEVLLERGSSALWKAVVSAGTSSEVKGGKYDGIVGTAPPTLEDTTAFASHLHIGWKPNGVPALTLPPLPPLPHLPPPPFHNVVIYAAEKGTPVSKQIPVNHAAESIAEFLRFIDLGTPTDVVEVGDPITFLHHIGAHFGPPQRIRYLFYLGHAYEAGLNLTNFPKDIPYMPPSGGGGSLSIHDPAVETALHNLYAASIPFGADDYSMFRTHQMRVSNLRLLPHGFRANLRDTLSEAEGIFILGCRSADQLNLKDTTFCQELANVSGRPVYGAAYYSKFLTPSDAGEWVEYHKNRTQPAPTDRQVVLVPAQGIGSALLFLRRHQTFRSIPDPIPTSDLLAVYAHILTRCDPVVTP